MTPKEKAEELIKRYYRDSDLLVEDLTWIQAKECALIAIEEILEVKPSKKYWDTYSDETPSAITYWQEVKTEINNL